MISKKYYKWMQVLVAGLLYLMACWIAPLTGKPPFWEAVGTMHFMTLFLALVVWLFYLHEKYEEVN